MTKIRVLVVDDSVVIRRLVGDSLKQDPSIELAGISANGKIALQMIPQVNPDIVTLDIEMPVMDGIETVRRIRETYPDLPVIMFSTLTERGGTATLDALSAGATDYVTKPANVGSVNTGIKRVEEELIPKIKSLCGRSVRPVPKVSSAPRPVPEKKAPRASIIPIRRKRSFVHRTTSMEIVALGCSTGGPNALAQVIPQLPAEFPVPIVIVQHMPSLFTKLLAERLDQQSNVRVFEGSPGTEIKAGSVYIAPGDYHMVVRRHGTKVRLETNQDAPENSCRPAVDVLFRSVVNTFGDGTLGVILTGMGQDGLRGCELLREAGGPIIVQDEATSVVWGMPGFVAKAELADRILPLDQVPQEMVRRVSLKRRPAGPNVVAGLERSVVRTH